MHAKKIGLTLGKFAPLHSGHQYMFETALAEMDEVIVIIYDSPDATAIPLPVRSGWIQQLYPQIHVIEAWNGPVESGYTPAIMHAQEQYVIGLLKGRTVTHFYSSERYGDHMSKALQATDRQVDPARVTYPISGTQIREAAHTHRQFVAPLVYRDLLTSVVLLGAPSTGKTTLAAALADTYQTVWMPEYGREYWAQHQQDRRLAPEQLVEIAEGHIEREDALCMEANRYLIVDTNAITTSLFAHYYHGAALPRLTELAHLAATRYDLVFLCETDIPYDNTWDRSGEVHREVFQKQMKADLLQRKIPFIPLSGSLGQRVAKVEAVLKAYTKYDNLGELWGQRLTKNGI
ncbi:AAA family ATPase [Paenibacillus agricola]|uniref:AAA family ATPase n=1 Tax=Paenibacillus agricola TaxID=2716264 RepID=A0ABX0J0D0_9BACL|nr:AAA family ATPase [Paenibacillus agricola]NHN29423.1 AAA family ATPase [Paenibacillus agricola]